MKKGWFILFLLTGCAHWAVPDISFPLQGVASTLGRKASPLSPPKRVTYAWVLQKAWERNPEIQAAKWRWRAAMERVPQAESYPNPLFSFTYYVREVETRVGPQRQAFSLSQKIPFPGKLSLKGEIERVKVQKAAIQFEQTVISVLSQVKEIYYELFFLEEARKLYQKQKLLLERYVAFAAGEFSKKVGRFFPLFKAQSFLAQIHYEELLLAEKQTAVLEELRALLDLPPEFPLKNLSPPPFIPLKAKLSTLQRLAERESELLRLAQKEVEKRVAEFRLARLSHLPDFVLSAKWIETGNAVNPSLPGSGKDPIMLTLGVSIPLWWGRDEAKIREKRFAIWEGLAKRQSVWKQIRARVANLYFQWWNAERLRILYGEKLIPQAKKAMVTAEEEYRRGVMSYESLLETVSAWLNFQLAYYRALADCGKWRARLERVIGKVWDESWER